LDLAVSVAPDDPLGDLLPERRVTMALWLRVPCIVLGTVCMGLGFVGWAVPGMPGLPFHLAGLALLHVSTPTGCRVINWCDRRMPAKARRMLRFARRQRPPAANPPDR
jgi:hypothetical protein